MELFLQYGDRMKSLSKTLITRWGNGTVILSARDLKPDQVSRTARDIDEVGGINLIDSKLFNPRATHKTLKEHPYWPKTYDTNMLFDKSYRLELLNAVFKLNEDARVVGKYILPGIYGSRINGDWNYIQNAIIEDGKDIFIGKKLIATISISAEVLRSEEQVENLLSFSEDWDVNGYYVVVEHYKNSYLVEDFEWLSNFLILCSGLKLQNREVIVGYSSHQMLCLAAANVDAIASGHWLNVRQFDLDNLNQNDEAFGKHNNWYYCPQTLSEYKVSALDAAFRGGILQKFRPEPNIDSGYAEVLFSGALPTSTSYDQQMGFSHYLYSLREQCLQATKPTFRETLDYQFKILDEAEQLIKEFRQLAISGGDRDFREIIDINRQALVHLSNIRGFALDRSWKQ